MPRPKSDGLTKAHLDKQLASMSGLIAQALADVFNPLQARVAQVEERLDRIWKNMPRSTKRSRDWKERRRETPPVPKETKPVEDDQFRRELVTALQKTQESVIALAHRVQSVERNNPLGDDAQMIRALREGNGFPPPPV